MPRSRMAPLVFLLESVGSSHVDLLTRSSFRVHAFRDSAPVVDEVVRLHPVAIAADLDHPLDDFDLFAFARQLHEDHRTQHVPIVAFSRNLQAEHIESAARVGILSIRTGFLPDDSKLVAVIRGVVAASPSAKAQRRRSHMASCSRARLTAP